MPLRHIFEIPDRLKGTKQSRKEKRCWLIFWLIFTFRKNGCHLVSKNQLSRYLYLSKFKFIKNCRIYIHNYSDSKFQNTFITSKSLLIFFSVRKLGCVCYDLRHTDGGQLVSNLSVADGTVKNSIFKINMFTFGGKRRAKYKVFHISLSRTNL